MSKTEQVHKDNIGRLNTSRRASSQLEDISDIIETVTRRDLSNEVVNISEKSNDSLGIEVHNDNKRGVVNSIKNRLANILKKRGAVEAETIERITNNKIEDFKNRMSERLSNMGIDKYRESISTAGGFIKKLCVDYLKNTNQKLKFRLAVEKNKNNKSKKIILLANDFIESVNLDKVVAKVNNNDNESSGAVNVIDLSEYLEVTDMNAIDAMNGLRDTRISLTPKVTRWFRAVQQIVGAPKEDEPFRNYLQRAMSMKYDVDSNLSNPEKENIESALQEIVPILHKELAEKKLIKDRKMPIVDSIKDDKINDIQDSDRGEEVNGSLSLGEKMISAIEKDTGGRIDMNDYNIVSRLDAKQVMVTLKRIAEYTGKSEMAKLIGQEIGIDGENLEDKTFSEYVDSNLDHLQLLQKNIRHDLEDLNLNVNNNTSAEDIFGILARNKDKLKYTESKSMAKLFKMGGIAAPMGNETLDDYFDRLENYKKNELHYFLKYAVPNLRRAMKKTVYNKKRDLK